MPGLVGIVSTRGEKVNLDLMQAMRNAIRHRDWHKMDDYVSPKGTVAVSRVHLGIINEGRQPYSARNGRVKIFLHGEIYNDQVVNSNPLDFIYQLYEKSGMGFASSLNGSFVIAIVDEEEDIVLIANDRIASKPLFCFDDGRAIYFGPEMKSLFLTPTLKRNLKLAAVADLLANGYFTREHTLIENLEAVDNATVLRITAGGVARHRYWEHPFTYGFQQEGKERSQRHYQEKLGELLRKAVSRRLRTDHTCGILLSGGYDSRGILGCYLGERDNQELHTISWGWKEDIPSSDCVVARRLAQKLGADHRFYKRPAEEVVDGFRDFILLGEGLTDEAASYGVFDRIREQQGVEIVLRGDEFFGSLSHLVYDEHTMLRSLGLRLLRNMSEYQRVLKPSYYQTFCELDAETRRYISSQCSATHLRVRKDFFEANLLVQHYLNPLNYIKTSALESFTPWLDYDIWDFMSTLPVKYRLDRFLYRKTVLEMFPELFEEFAQTGNGIDWADSFKNIPALQRLAYRELIEEQNIFSEFMDIDGLKTELDAFFAPSNSVGSQRLKAKVKTNAFKLLQLSSAAYDFAHKSVYHIRKWRGRIRDPLPPERLIMRLLILKVWGDVFVNYPVVTTSK